MKKNLHIFRKISFLLLSVILLPQFSVAQDGFGLNIRVAPRNTRGNPHNPNIIHNLRPDILGK